MESIQIGDLRVAYEIKGTGPPLVLLHGALADSRVWLNQIEEFSADFTVLSWDAPGCGQSSDPPETFRLQDYSDCLASLINELGLSKPHLLGLSFGGGLAIDFCHHYPELPGSLTLVSAYAGWAGSLPPDEVKKRLESGIRQSRQPPDKVIQSWIPTLFLDSVPDHVIDFTSRIMADFHPAGMRAMLRAFAQADLREVLPRINIPVLLIYGDSDKRSPLHIAKEMHENIPASKLVILEGIGHVVNLEAPEIFNSEVRQFLKSHRIDYI